MIFSTSVSAPALIFTRLSTAPNVSTGMKWTKTKPANRVRKGITRFGRKKMSKITLLRPYIDPNGREVISVRRVGNYLHVEYTDGSPIQLPMSNLSGIPGSGDKLLELIKSESETQWNEVFADLSSEEIPGKKVYAKVSAGNYNTWRTFNHESCMVTVAFYAGAIGVYRRHASEIQASTFSARRKGRLDIITNRKRMAMKTLDIIRCSPNNNSLRPDELKTLREIHERYKYPHRFIKLNDKVAHKGSIVLLPYIEEAIF